ncbi:adenylate kinase [Crepidotus variabilis]|uniref:Adenylate kinase n=1 Tax=Crepidotus variabilis TaxID=179855 RepID=A0A9P6ESG8_9AGAR|nr:adenylate kinase [Crepidotus variabilis]
MIIPTSPSLFGFVVVLLFALTMQSNIRNGIRTIHKRSLSVPTATSTSSSTSLALRSAAPTCSAIPGSQRTIASSSTTYRAIPFSLNLNFTTSNHPSSDADERKVRMLMFGKPGAGKGTLTSRLAQKYDILTLSTGDLLRQHINERTEVGKEAEAIIARGELVPDEVVIKVVTSKLEGLQNKHWILDGFPRTQRQGELLDAHLQKRNTPLTLIVNLDVADEVILGRISDRWVHLPSGRVYNMSYNRPRVEGFDDQTGEPLTKRPDDNPETFARRLQKFYSATSPLLDYYATAASSEPTGPNHQHPHQVAFHRPSGLRLKTLSGATSDEIWPQLDQLLQNTFPGLRERAGMKVETRRPMFVGADKQIQHTVA